MIFYIKRLYTHIIFYVSLFSHSHFQFLLQFSSDFQDHLNLHQNFSTFKLLLDFGGEKYSFTEFVRETTTKLRDLRRLTIVGGHVVVLILISG